VARIIVERNFGGPVSDGDLEAVSTKVTSCLELFHARWIRSYVSADRTRGICEFDAPDLESIRALQREAGAPFERVWSADLIEH
jgi:hypothetical protein